MARTEAVIPAPPEDVFAVLADPRSYGDWVVGSQTIRGVEGDWPSLGSRFHHRVGVGPLTIADHTEVLEVDPPRRLLLDARAQPLGRAHVLLELTPQNGVTRVTMTETPGDRKSRLVAGNRVGDALIGLRNTVSLRRLARLATERRAASPPG
jgi:uncharacterized protein YndB with AHSA1/START domain